MANNWLVIKAKRFEIGDLTKFNKFFYLLKSISKKRYVLCEQTRMLIKQNENNDISKLSLNNEMQEKYTTISVFTSYLQAI